MSWSGDDDGSRYDRWEEERQRNEDYERQQSIEQAWRDQERQEKEERADAIRRDEERHREALYDLDTISDRPYSAPRVPRSGSSGSGGEPQGVIQELFHWKTILVWAVIVVLFWYFPFMAHGAWSSVFKLIAVMIGLSTVPSLVKLIFKSIVIAIVSLTAIYMVAAHFFPHTAQPPSTAKAKTTAVKAKSNSQHQ